MNTVKFTRKQRKEHRKQVLAVLERGKHIYAAAIAKANREEQGLPEPCSSTVTPDDSLLLHNDDN